VKFYPDVPLIFDVEKDPQEAFPLTNNNTMPTDPDLIALVKVRLALYVAADDLAAQLHCVTC